MIMAVKRGAMIERIVAMSAENESLLSHQNPERIVSNLDVFLIDTEATTTIDPFSFVDMAGFQPVLEFMAMSTPLRIRTLFFLHHPPSTFSPTPPPSSALPSFRYQQPSSLTSPSSLMPHP